MKCFDTDNNLLKLTQWDSNRIIVLKDLNYTGSLSFQFYNDKSEKAAVVKPNILENTVTCKIPNIFLTVARTLTVAIYETDEFKEGKVIQVFELPIERKKRPDDFYFENDKEIVDWNKITTEAKILLESLKNKEQLIEEIHIKSQNAERIAQSVRDDADNGLFNGDPYEHSVEFETLSKQVRDDALKSAQSEKNASVSATKSEQSATASEASAKASETSSVNAKTSETNAKGSENQSTQNLEDLIAMLGTQVATLVDGKIPLDQIPATATVENYVIKSEDELITLTAQKGDVAHLVEDVEGKKTITKTWQLLGADSKVKDNWILWGTSYAVQAGYATIAGTSNDSERINGMRFVTMNYSDFETAVKDPNTLYAIDMGA